VTSISIEELKARLPIEQVIGSYLVLRKAGPLYKAPCPFHNEKTASFTVSPERRSFHCFGCAKHGDVIDFVMEMDHSGWKETVQSLAQQAGVEIVLSNQDQDRDVLLAVNARAVAYYHERLLSPAGAGLRRFLQEERGLSEATIRRERLGYAPGDITPGGLAQALGLPADDLLRAGLTGLAQDGKHYPRFRGRLLFPILRQGKVLGFGGRALGIEQPKYLNTGQTALFEKGALLYQADAAFAAARRTPGHVVVVVEGYFDALLCHQAGYANTVASMGTALTEQHLAMLAPVAEQVIIALDGDAAGTAAAEKTLRLAISIAQQAPGGRAGRLPFIASLPPGQDPDDLLRGDAAAWPALLASALPVTDYLFRQLEQAPVSAEERRRRAGNDLLPLLALLPDPLERGAAIDRLALLLGLPGPAVAAAMAKQASAPVRPAPGAAGPGVLSADQGLPVLTGYEQERTWCALLLRYPELLPEARRQQHDLVLTEPRLQACWQALLAGGDPGPPGLVAALQQETAGLPPLDAAVQEQARQQSALRLRLAALDRQLAALTAGLREAPDQAAALLPQVAALHRQRQGLLVAGHPA
jgi:DNA primase